MPIEYKTYGCKFKCGYRHNSVSFKVYLHEKDCWYNPENRCCVTCKHGQLVREYNEHDELPGSLREEWEYRICDIDHEIEFDGIRPHVNCEKWELT